MSFGQIAANLPIRLQGIASDTLCLTIDVWERGQRSYYRMRENSPALIESELYRIINSLIQPHLVEASAVQSSSRPKGHLPN